MKKIDKNVDKVINYIKRKTNNNPDYIYKSISFFNYKIKVLFCESLSNRNTVNDFILEFFEEKNNQNKKNIKNIITFLEENLPTNKIIIINNYDEVFYNLCSGYTVIIINGHDKALAIETKEKLDSGVIETKNEQIIKGPKDAFTENYQTNIGLVRKRLKTEKLWLKELIVGEKSKTKVGIMYIEDIASKELVKILIDKVKKIDIDGIFDSNYIIETISDNKTKFFPSYFSTERPDLVSMLLLEGRIAIIVENTQYAAVIPAVFKDFFHSTEDYYQKVANVNFTRMVRIMAFLAAILIPAFYIAIATFNIEAIPGKMLMSFFSQREGVPLPTVLETLMMIITFEILRETDSRLPNVIGSSLSIVGAIVLGQAAVMAGIVSPLTIIVVSITAISGMISSNMDMANGVRLWRIIFIIFASFFGILGIVLAGFIFLIYITSIKSFGLPYLLPIAPFNAKDQKNSIFLTNKRKYVVRPLPMAKKNKYRTGEVK